MIGWGVNKHMQYNPDIHHRQSIRLKGYDYSRPGAYFITICVQDRHHLFGEIKSGKMVLNEFGLIVAEEWKRSEEIRKEIKLDAFVVMPNHIHGILVINTLSVSNGFDGDKSDGTIGMPGIMGMAGLNEMAGADDTTVGATGRSPLRHPSPIPHPSPDRHHSYQHGDGPPQPYGSSVINKIEQLSMSVSNGPKPKSVGSFVAGFKPAVSKRINEKRGTPGSPVWQRNYYDHIIRNEQEFAAIRYYIINNPINWIVDLLYKKG
jgi:putative transposase